MEDSVKIEAIREILEGLRWDGGKYTYRPKKEEVPDAKWISPDTYDRDNIDEMIDEIKKIVVSE